MGGYVDYRDTRGFVNIRDGVYGGWIFNQRSLDDFCDVVIEMDLRN